MTARLPATAIVLAGGRSARFGSDKAEALLRGRSMLDWVLAAVSGVCDEVIIVGGPPRERPGVRYLAEEGDLRGPLGGMVAGMRVARFDACFATACDAPLLAPAIAHAQFNRPIRLIIPFAPGGTSDILARLMAPGLGAALGQPVIVENRTGANGNIAADLVAKSPPDGHTALFTISGFVQNLVLQANPPYKASDLAPVSLVASFPIAMAANAALPAATASVPHASRRPNVKPMPGCAAT